MRHRSEQMVEQVEGAMSGDGVELLI